MEDSNKLEALHQQMQQAYKAEQYNALKSHVESLLRIRQQQDDNHATERHVLEGLLQQLSFPHPDLLYVSLFLAKYFTHKDNSFAEELFKWVAAVTMQTFGESSFDAGRRIIDLADFYTKTGNVGEAITSFRVGIYLLQETNIKGESDFSIPYESARLAELYLETGDYANYESILSNTINWYKRLANKERDSPAVVKNIYEQKADLLLKLADYYLDVTESFDKALSYYTDLKAYYQTSQPLTIMLPLCENRMGVTYEKSQHWQEAISHYQQAKYYLIELFGTSHPDIAWIEERIYTCQQYS